MRPKTDIRTEIRSCLSSLQESGAFAFGSSFTSLPLPGLHIRDHGDIGLPLSTNDAQVIISKAQPLALPEDKKAETDDADSPAKIWELSNKKVSLENPEWKKGVSSILAAIYQGFDLKSGVAKFDAKFVKLVLYEAGASLEHHKNTPENHPELFGSLVICLPSAHEGGKIVFMHDTKKYEFDAQSNSRFDFSFAAHYDDITYDMLPITSGYRLELLYNLVRSPESIGSAPPSGKGVRDSVRQLLLLLARYDAETEKQDTGLPHLLIHHLEHTDTDSDSNFEDLRGIDAQQAESLKQLSAHLGFEMYLATLIHEISEEYNGVDFWESDRLDGMESEPETEEKMSLENIVGLNGSTIDNYSDYVDEEQLLQPEAYGEHLCNEEDQRCSKYGFYEIRRGCHKVLVLVPSRRKIEFVVKTSDPAERILREFEDLKGRSPEDPYKILQLSKLCELILDESPDSWNTYSKDRYGAKVYQEIGLAALDMGRLDLFDRASTETSGLVVLHNAAAMGSLAARTSMLAMKDRLDVGVKAAKTDEALGKFMEEVETNFKKNLTNPAQYVLNEFYNWKTKAFFLAILDSGGLNKANGQWLLNISTYMEWIEFEKYARPLLESGLTVGKTAFLNKLVSQRNDDLTIEQRSLAEWLVKNIWNTFSFHWDHATNPAVDAHVQANYLLDGSDFLHLIQNTYSILPSLTLSETIIPVILKAIPQASVRSITFTCMSIAHCLLSDDKPDLTPISKVDGLSLEDTCSSLTQILLYAYLQGNVNTQPVHPKDWSVPVSARCCGCRDCSEVVMFLKSTVRQEFEIKAPENRRKHLSRTFEGYYGQKPDGSYDVSTIRKGTPHTWRIVKHRRHFERQVQDWRKQVQTAKAELGTLIHNRHAKRKLQTYLGEYYDTFMNADRDGLPDLESRFTTKGLNNMSQAGINLRTGQKRSHGRANDSKVTNKKAKSNVNGEAEDSTKENEAEEIEVVDLTDI